MGWSIGREEVAPGNYSLTEIRHSITRMEWFSAFAGTSLPMILWRAFTA
jgi:hypothetical protein